MTDLPEKWKEGELDGLEELIKQIKVVYDSRSLSDEYLKENDCMTREECYVAEEHSYGIVTVISDYVLPYLEQLQRLKKENSQFRQLLKDLYKKTESYLVGEKYGFKELGWHEKAAEFDNLLTLINAAIGESEE